MNLVSTLVPLEAAEPFQNVVPVDATGLFVWAWLLIAIPALSAAILLLAGKAADGWGHLMGTAAPIASFVLAAVLFGSMFTASADQRAISVPMYEVMSTGSWTFEASLLLDQLSILFVLLITGVGSLIHIYSIEYMAHDPRRRRFFAYLNLFIAAMLLLVLADNYLTLFVGWEGVGLASYLLIGFWQHKPSAALAAKKAFVVNRVGDLGLLMGTFTFLALVGSSSFADVNDAAGSMPSGWATFAGFMLLLAACGKSAQVPLQSWLLDAMEGPTPVSALIHAATMVTAGVYLVVRSHVVYAQSDVALVAVAIVGTVTLLAGAWIGTSKDDIKKVLAGSTMSQIGYMMLAAGLGPIGAAFAIFHLITHGAFKANMFLGAGSVMHAMNDDVDMRHFGALQKALPITFITFAMGYLAIIGFPFTSGYYSKDHIIEAAFERNTIFGVLALLGAGVTAFYMTRLMMMTWFGQKRWRDDVHPHEGSWLMTMPLVVLAILSLILGLVLNNWIGGWLQPAIGSEEGHPSLFHFSAIGAATLAVVAVGVFVGWWFFRGEVPDTQPKTRNVFVLAGRNDLYGDAFNETVFIQPGQMLVGTVQNVDRSVVDAATTAIPASASVTAAQGLRRLQNGQVRSYGLTMVGGAIVLGLVIAFGHWV